MAVPSIIDILTGQRLIRIVRRILAPGVHTAPGYGVTIYAPEGTKRETLATANVVAYRFFVTPFKAFPLLREGFSLPVLRCDGRGLTITAQGGTPPTVLEQRLGAISATVPIPWPEGSVGNPGPDYVPPKERKKRAQGGSS